MKLFETAYILRCLVFMRIKSFHFGGSTTVMEQATPQLDVKLTTAKICYAVYLQKIGKVHPTHMPMALKCQSVNSEQT